MKIGGADYNLGHELANELAMPSYDFNKQGGVIVQSKRRLPMPLS